MDSKQAIKNTKGVFAACLLLIAFLAATMWLWRNAKNTAEQNALNRFNFKTHEAVLKIKERMSAYKQVLRGAVALFAASKTVTRDEWRTYQNTMNIRQNYPGIQGAGFVQRVFLSEKDAHIRQIRSEGFQDYAIRPEESRAEYYPIVYLEPFTGSNRIEFGYDICSEPVRLAAMELARDTGEAAITGNIRLVQETEKEGQAGFHMLLSVYKNGRPHATVEQRRKNLIGYVTSPFRMNDLMHGILGEREPDIDLEIFDGTEISEKNLMYDDDDDVVPLWRYKTALFRQTATIDINGHTWTLLFSSRPAFEDSVDTLPSRMILLSGILISLLISTTVWLFSERHVEIAALNERLKTENAEHMQSLSLLNATFDSTADGILAVDRNGKISGFNKKFAEMWRIPESILASKDDNKALNFVTGQLKDPKNFYDKIMELYSQPEAVSFDTLEFKDGRVFERYSQPQMLDNKTIGRVWSFRDVTSRKDAEKQLELAKKVFDNSAEAILVTGAARNIISVNKAFIEITGYAPEEVIGKNPKIMSSGRHDSAFYKKLWTSINKSGYWQGEIWDRRKNGEIYPKWLTISAVADKNGKVSNYIGIFSDITHRKTAEERIQFMAYYDALTRLPNRALMHDRLNQAIAEAKRNNKKVGLLFLDLDRFKNINDSLGHRIGDMLLQAVAARLKGCLRQEDTVSRIGGDEFVVILLDIIEAEDAATAAGKIISAMSAAFSIDNHELNISPSIGISIHPDDGDYADTLIKYADAAMYHAKEAGRNTYQFFTQEMNIRNFERLFIENSLRSAIEKKEFVLHYQPQINISTMQIIGTEALIRWQHPEMGLVPPAKFIPVAEESGLISQIGEWTLYAACEQNRQWQKSGLPAIPMAVNISAVQFRQKNFHETVARVLQESGLKPRYLELEITEGAVMQDVESTIAILQKLKDKGLSLTIDDFGTGYSSLNYLKRFPIGKLKIDRSFVMNIAADTDDAAIVLAVIGMAHSLRLKVIAEGVETDEQLAFLRAHKCNEIQGYYFSKPLPADEYARLLKNGVKKQNAG